MRRAEFKCVGLTFREGQYPANLFAILQVIEERQRDAILGDGEEFYLGQDGEMHSPDGEFAYEPVKVVLVREPGNEHDPNAVKVHVPLLGRKRSFIGFVPKLIDKKPFVEKLAAKMDAGIRFNAVVKNILISVDNPNQPGCELQVWRQGENPVSQFLVEDPSSTG